MSSWWLRVGGVPATEIAAHTPPSWETLADGGCGAASFAFAMSARAQHQALRPGSLVEIMCGPGRVWVGLLNEPDRSTWECHASGLSSSARSYFALDGGGASTRDLGVAISAAIARGWRGSNPSHLAGPVAGDASGNPVTVGALLDDYAGQTGQRWGVDHLGALYVRPDPTDFSWVSAPGTAVFAPSDEDAPASLIGRYFDGTSNQTAFAGGGFPEAVVDLTDRGTLGLMEAPAILAGMLVRSGVTSWVGSARLHREQITTRGGVPANLAAVRAGQMIRVHGFSYGLVSGAPWLDVTIGKTSYTAGEDTIVLEPVNSAPRSLSDVIAAA